MGELTVRVVELEPGDELVGSSERLVVAGVQSLGPVAIIDFTDSTSTAPVASSGAVTVRRPGSGAGLASAGR